MGGQLEPIGLIMVADMVLTATFDTLLLPVTIPVSLGSGEPAGAEPSDDRDERS